MAFTFCRQSNTHTTYTFRYMMAIAKRKKNVLASHSACLLESRKKKKTFRYAGKTNVKFNTIRQLKKRVPNGSSSHEKKKISLNRLTDRSPVMSLPNRPRNDTPCIKLFENYCPHHIKCLFRSSHTHTQSAHTHTASWWGRPHTHDVIKHLRHIGHTISKRKNCYPKTSQINANFIYCKLLNHRNE